MLNSEIIYTVKEQTDKDKLSDNTGFEDEQILFYLLRARSTLLYRKHKQYKNVSDNNIMSTPCLNLIPAKECPCLPPKGCNAYMTEKVIPQSITGIISVTNADGDKEYKKTKPNLEKYRSQQRIKKFADNTSWLSIDEGSGTRIFVFSNKPLKLIKAQLIPENPEELQRMCDCNGDNQYNCTSTYELEWKLDAELTHTAIDITISNLLGTRASVTDIKNNSIDDNNNNKAEIIGTNS